VALLNNFLLFYKELSDCTKVIHRLITYYTQVIPKIVNKLYTGKE